MAIKKNDGELSTFRISDMKRAEVRSFAKATASSPEPQQAQPSVGFPAVEARLEGGSIDDLVEAIRPSYEKLEQLTQKGDMKSKAAAKKAMAAYERTADLFEYLFATKAALSR